MILGIFSYWTIWGLAYLLSAGVSLSSLTSLGQWLVLSHSPISGCQQFILSSFLDPGYSIPDFSVNQWMWPSCSLMGALLVPVLCRRCTPRTTAIPALCREPSMSWLQSCSLLCVLVHGDIHLVFEPCFDLFVPSLIILFFTLCLVQWGGCASCLHTFL